MSEIKNGRFWMALDTFKCNCLRPLHFKGLIKNNNCMPKLRQRHLVSAMVMAETGPRVSASDSVSLVNVYSVSATVSTTADTGKISLGRSLFTTAISL